MLTTSLIAVVLKDQPLEISVQMAQDAFFAFLSSIFLPCHFEPVCISEVSLDKQIIISKTRRGTKD